MSVTQNLITGETIVFESKKHWIAPIRASLVAVLMMIGAGSSGSSRRRRRGSLRVHRRGARTLMDIAALVLFVGGVGWIIYNVVAWRTAEFAVTNVRVLREEGLASQAELHDPAVVAERRERGSASSAAGSASGTSPC